MNWHSSTARRFATDRMIGVMTAGVLAAALGVLSGTGVSSAEGINNHGEVVGLSSTSDLSCAPLPFIWRRGVMRAISQRLGT